MHYEGNILEPVYRQVDVFGEKLFTELVVDPYFRQE